MTSKLKDFMFSTPLTYSELRAVKHIQSLKHVKSQHTDARVKAAQEKESPPTVRVSVSQLSEWRKVSPFYFAGGGAGLGMAIGLFKALKHYITRIWKDPQSKKEYHLDTFGLWGSHQDLPHGGYDLKIFEAGDVVEKLQVRQRHHSLWDALNLSPTRYASVTRRQYQENRFIDTHVQNAKDGSIQVNRSLKSKRGIFPQFEARFNPQGDLDALTHTVQRGNEDYKIDLSPIQHEGQNALVAHEKRGEYTFILNKYARTASMLVKDPNTNTHYQVLSTVENRGPFGRSLYFDTENAPIRILRGDKQSSLKKVAWKDLTPHEKTLLEHPLFFRQLMPLPEDKALLDLTSHIPEPLRSPSLKWNEQKGLSYQRPWKEWLGKPLGYAAAFAGMAVLVQQFLLSPKSPFSRWLNEHVQVHSSSHHQIIGNNLPQNGQILYVKDTGNESADASIGKALRVLSNFGLIKASVVHHNDKKPEKLEKLIQTSPTPQNA
jgi:hypothetical protein